MKVQFNIFLFHIHHSYKSEEYNKTDITIGFVCYCLIDKCRIKCFTFFTEMGKSILMERRKTNKISFDMKVDGNASHMTTNKK